MGSLPTHREHGKNTSHTRLRTATVTHELISYDPAGVFLPEHGITPADIGRIAARLDEARDEVLADAQIWADGVEPPPAKQPLDAGFHELPERLLNDYRTNGAASEVGRIKATADRLAATVDRAIVLGIGGSYMGARALLEACCHPYYNELPRAARGGRPRISFEGNNVDNDALQGLLDLVGRGAQATGVDDRWGIVVISKSGGTLETAAAFRVLVRTLRDSCGGDGKKLAELVVPVTGTSGKLFDLAQALGCPGDEIYEVPDGVGGRFSVLSAVGLLPAAVMGLDVVKLLEGAVAMNEHFRNCGPESNVVLQYVGVCHLMETMRGCDVRLLSTWGKRLEAVGLWYDQLLSESLGKQEQGAMPLTVVNTRDLHSRGQQHQEGKRDKLITNVIVKRGTREPLAIGASDLDQDKLNQLAGKTIPDVLDAATKGTNQAYRDDNRPTADLHLPRLDEHALGQLFQMLMLATVVEGRLIGVNPYGQPGVEAYKNNMNAILRA
ncbi:MAG: glucose-6-phosphate isomerase [Pirellulales bacterium]|nr:glucose-6-phosphate isomerase [Pirellulales bacterium]